MVTSVDPVQSMSHSHKEDFYNRPLFKSDYAHLHDRTKKTGHVPPGSICPGVSVRGGT